jgi:hypothetical protein
VNNDPVNYIDLWGLCKAEVRSDPTANVPSPDGNVFQTWSAKEDGATLTREEAALQMTLGGLLTTAGIAGGLGAGGPKAVIPGWYLAADGAWVFSEGQVNRKATPLKVFVKIASKSIIF